MLSIQSSSSVVAHNLEALMGQLGIAVLPEAAILLQHDAQGLTLIHGSIRQPLALPMAPAQLAAAIHRLNRPANLPQRLPLAHGWQLDTAQRMLTREHAEIPLTEKESLLLAQLAQKQSITREQLLADVWRYEPATETHTLETHIYRLRQKLESLDPAPCRIETLDGCYQLVL